MRHRRQLAEAENYGSLSPRPRRSGARLLTRGRAPRPLFGAKSGHFAHSGLSFGTEGLCPGSRPRRTRSAGQYIKGRSRKGELQPQPRQAFGQAGAASCSVGPVTATQETLSSDLPDVGDVPLDTDLAIDDEEYARIMRRIGLAEGEPGTTVSAFNSSI